MNKKTVIITVIVIIVLAVIVFFTSLNFTGNQQAAVIKSGTAPITSTSTLITAGTKDCGMNLYFGTASMDNLIVKLQPNVRTVVRWDFTQCEFGIQNFDVYAALPRTKTGRVVALPTTSGVTFTGKNITTGVVAYKIEKISGSYLLYFDRADKSVIEATLVNTSAKPIDVELSHTEAQGGPSIR